ncbi:MAG: hypothetical protein Q9182_007281 [Xanthomendoza sp. 2 TL-2023]
MEVLHSSPIESQFIPLSDHQSHTPSSFHSGPPILYHHSPATAILINSNELDSTPALKSLLPPQQQINGSSTEGAPDDLGHEITIEGVDIWVTSDKFLLFSPTLAAGISVPYPSISLHAVQRSPQPSLLLQILSSSGPRFDDHDPEGTISMTIVPRSESAPASLPQPEAPPQSSSPTTVERLFSALSACADLHPDPTSNSDVDADEDNAFASSADTEAHYTQIDGLPPPMPGSGGWITAENVGEFFDEEGSFRGGGGLGEGAGRVRGRGEDEGRDAVDGDGVEGGDGEGEESKWRRTG